MIYIKGLVTDMLEYAVLFVLLSGFALTPQTPPEASLRIYVEQMEFDSILDIAFLEDPFCFVVLSEQDGLSRLDVFDESGFYADHLVLDGWASAICDHSSAGLPAVAVTMIKDGSLYFSVFGSSSSALTRWEALYETPIPESRAPGELHRLSNGRYAVVRGFMDEEDMSAGFEVGVLTIPVLESLETSGYPLEPGLSAECSFEALHVYTRAYSNIEELYTILIEPPRMGAFMSQEGNRLYVSPPSRETYELECYDLDSSELQFRLYSDPGGDRLLYVKREPQLSSSFPGLPVYVREKSPAEIEEERANALSISEMLADWQPSEKLVLDRRLHLTSDGFLFVERGTDSRPHLDCYDTEGRYLDSYWIAPFLQTLPGQTVPLDVNLLPWSTFFSVGSAGRIAAFSAGSSPNHVYLLKIEEHD